MQISALRYSPLMPVSSVAQNRYPIAPHAQLATVRFGEGDLKTTAYGFFTILALIATYLTGFKNGQNEACPPSSVSYTEQSVVPLGIQTPPPGQVNEGKVAVSNIPAECVSRGWYYLTAKEGDTLLGLVGATVETDRRYQQILADNRQLLPGFSGGIQVGQTLCFSTREDMPQTTLERLEGGTK